MNVWDITDDADHKSLVNWCTEDRERLADDFFLHRPNWEGKPASYWLEEMLELCGVQVRDCPLPPKQLGLCDLRENFVFINSEMKSFVHHRTNLKALRASTLAHELGHVRLHQDEDDSQVFVNNYQDKNTFQHPRAFQREREADLYAALFLVPLPQLKEHRVAKRFRRYREQKRQISSYTLLNGIGELSRHFRVTRSLIQRYFIELGWIQRHMTDKGKRLRLKWEAFSN